MRDQETEAEEELSEEEETTGAKDSRAAKVSVLLILFVSIMSWRSHFVGEL